jgi:hypothetical protein
MRKKPTNTPISLVIIYGSRYMFRHYNAILRERMRTPSLHTSRPSTICYHLPDCTVTHLGILPRVITVRPATVTFWQ